MPPALSPWLQRDDHLDDPPGGAVFRVSMPASIEGFVHSRFEGAQRIEFCHTDSHVLVRRGWSALAEGCVPMDQGRLVLPLTEKNRWTFRIVSSLVLDGCTE